LIDFATSCWRGASWSQTPMPEGCSVTASPTVAQGSRMTDRQTARDADFAAYLQARRASVLRTAYLLSGDLHTAEDLTQTAFAKLYLAWDRVRDRESIDGYLRRILVNENNSLWRRGWKRREYATDELPEPLPVVDSYDEGRGAALWDLVQTLPKKARAVLVLRYYEELSEAETADLLGVSVGTVKSQTSRALAALRERTPAHLNPADREDER
jgi:RNA polymerase sigma-70 factor (sigma-E family)